MGGNEIGPHDFSGEFFHTRDESVGSAASRSSVFVRNQGKLFCRCDRGRIGGFLKFQTGLLKMPSIDGEADDGKKRKQHHGDQGNEYPRIATSKGKSALC